MEAEKKQPTEKTEAVVNDYAIVRYAGKNFKLEQGKKITLPIHIDVDGTDTDKTVIFDEVLLLKSGDRSIIGTPLVAGAKVTGRVMSNRRDAKILVFKKRRRKGFKKKIGHRTPLCDVMIESFVASVA
jgi:large subunit ribosomal protein L21